jgi:hypothetical protein
LLKQHLGLKRVVAPALEFEHKVQLRVDALLTFQNVLVGKLEIVADEIPVDRLTSGVVPARPRRACPPLKRQTPLSFSPSERVAQYLDMLSALSRRSLKGGRGMEQSSATRFLRHLLREVRALLDDAESHAQRFVH